MKPQQWNRRNPAPLPLETPSYRPGQSRNNPHIGAVIRFWVNQYLEVSKRSFLFDQFLFGEDLERQILLVANPHLRPYQRQRIYVIISSRATFDKVPASYYLRQLIDYQPKMETALIHRIATTHEDPQVMRSILKHPNTDENTKIIAALKLGGSTL